MHTCLSISLTPYQLISERAGSSGFANDLQQRDTARNLQKISEDREDGVDFALGKFPDKPKFTANFSSRHTSKYTLITLNGK